jgi:hypothetical protein
MRISKDHVIVAAVSLSIGMAGTAGAAGLITGSQIEDGSIGIKDLSKSLRKRLRLRRGRAGPAGAKGDPGAAFDASSYLPLAGGTISGALGVGQTVRAGDGSPAAPAFSFLTQPGTGFYYSNGPVITAATNGDARAAISHDGIEAIDGYLRAGMDSPPPSGACTPSTLGRMVVVGNGNEPAELYICDDSSDEGPGGEWLVK